MGGTLRRPRLRRLRMAQIKIEPQQGGWPRNSFGVSPLTAQRGELLQFGDLMCKKSDGHGRQSGFGSIGGIER